MRRIGGDVGQRRNQIGNFSPADPNTNIAMPKSRIGSKDPFAKPRTGGNMRGNRRQIIRVQRHNCPARHMLHPLKQRFNPVDEDLRQIGNCTACPQRSQTKDGMTQAVTQLGSV